MFNEHQLDSGPNVLWKASHDFLSALPPPCSLLSISISSHLILTHVMLSHVLLNVSVDPCTAISTLKITIGDEAGASRERRGDFRYICLVLMVLVDSLRKPLPVIWIQANTSVYVLGTHSIPYLEGGLMCLIKHMGVSPSAEKILFLSIFEPITIYGIIHRALTLKLHLNNAFHRKSTSRDGIDKLNNKLLRVIKAKILSELRIHLITVPKCWTFPSCFVTFSPTDR